MKISIIGIGFVGGAMYDSFLTKTKECYAYDKFKKIGNIEQCINTDIMFFCLPTLFSEEKMEYDKSSIYETCEILKEKEYKGIIVLKSTVEPMTTEHLVKEYPMLKFIHNPEFLTAKTAYEDFHNQSHIVLGISSNIKEKDIEMVKKMYSEFYPKAEISLCSSTESESMKIFCNTFYSVKVQYFTELYLLCKKMGCSYEKVKELMLKNNWINPMHTTIPGPDGMISYGGYCFPKDTNALLKFMEKMESPNAVLKNTIEERDRMRPERFF